MNPARKRAGGSPGRKRAVESAARRRSRAKKPAKRSWTDVVAAVIRDGDKVLVTRRPLEAHLGGLDEFPGGHREGEETLEAAVVREVKEEVGLAVRVVGQLGIAWHADAGTRLALTFFDCACAGSTEIAPEIAKKSGARWVAIRELGSLQFPPANRDVVRRLVESGSRAAP